MKFILISLNKLYQEGRWDIDYHLPPEGINKFSKSILKPISAVADIVKEKSDPTKEPETPFIYIDIASIDVKSGLISSPQELVGSEAPSRARKVVHAYDLIISTCRPTRGAIAVIPEQLHNQICSTGFSVIRPKKGINPFYLHFAIRLQSTIEQFRKFSTGSSYPAILDNDVEKTLIPMPDTTTQDLIASHILHGIQTRQKSIKLANSAFEENLNSAIDALIVQKYENLNSDFGTYPSKSIEIAERLIELEKRDLLAAGAKEDVEVQCCEMQPSNH